MVALGVSQEYKDKGITGNSLWPATVIESLASINFKLGDRSAWRKATIISEATMGIILEGENCNGIMCIDDTYLRERWGFTDDDLVRYRCDPDVEPPRFLDNTEGEMKHGAATVKRGNIRKLNEDIERSNKAFRPGSKL